MTQHTQCGCDGARIQTDIQPFNIPGLSKIDYRLGSHSTFFDTLIARLTSPDFLKKELDEDREKMLAAIARLRTRDLDDPSIALLDCWATVSDVLTFYQQYIANEGYLATATERRSVHELAKQVGYQLKPGLSSSTYLAFSIDENQLAKDVNEINIPKGTAAKTIGERPQTFETSEDIVARPEWNELAPRTGQLPNLQSSTANSVSEIVIEGIGHDIQSGDPVLFTFPKDGAIDSTEDGLGKFTRIRECKVARELPELNQTRIEFRTHFNSSRAMAEDIAPSIRSLVARVGLSPIRDEDLYRQIVNNGNTILNACASPETTGLANFDGEIAESGRSLKSILEQFKTAGIEFDRAVSQANEVLNSIQKKEPNFGGLSAQILAVIRSLQWNPDDALKDVVRTWAIGTDGWNVRNEAWFNELPVAILQDGDGNVIAYTDAEKTKILRRLAPVLLKLAPESLPLDSPQSVLEFLTCVLMISGIVHDLEIDGLAHVQTDLAEAIKPFLAPGNLVAGWQLYLFATINAEFTFSQRCLGTENKIVKLRNALTQLPNDFTIEAWNATLRKLGWDLAGYPFCEILALSTDHANGLDDAKLIKKLFLDSKSLEKLPEFKIRDARDFWLNQDSEAVMNKVADSTETWKEAIDSLGDTFSNSSQRVMNLSLQFMGFRDETFWGKALNRTILNPCFESNKFAESVYRTDSLTELSNEFGSLKELIFDNGRLQSLENFLTPETSSDLFTEMNAISQDLNRIDDLNWWFSLANFPKQEMLRVFAERTPQGYHGLLNQLLGRDNQGVEYIQRTLGKFRSLNSSVRLELEESVDKIETARSDILKLYLSALDKSKKELATWQNGDGFQSALWQVLNSYLSAEFLESTNETTSLKNIENRLNGLDHQGVSLTDALKAGLARRNEIEPTAETKNQVNEFTNKIDNLLNQMADPKITPPIAIGGALEISEAVRFATDPSLNGSVASSSPANTSEIQLGVNQYLLDIRAEQDGTFSDSMFRAIQNIKPVEPSYQILLFKKKTFPFGHDSPLPQKKTGPDDPIGVEEDQIGEGDWKPDEESEFHLFLDQQMDGLSIGSFVCTKRLKNTNTTDDKEVIGDYASFEIADRSIKTRKNYGLVRKTTELVVRPDWWEPATETNINTLRTTRVFTDSQIVKPAPLTVDSLGFSRDKSFEDSTLQLQLSKLVNGIRTGHKIAIQGETLVVDSAQELNLKRSGTTATEVLTVSLASQVFRSTYPGDIPLTMLKFTESLKNIYDRNTVKIYANLAPATHGETKQESLGNGEGYLPGQKFKLSHKFVSQLPSVDSPKGEPQVESLVNNVYWDRVDQMSKREAKDRVFESSTNSDSATIVKFGDGKRGARLPDGDANVVAKYRTGLGNSGNVNEKAITQLASHNAGLDKVFNPIRATGGADPETVLQSRISIPIASLGLDRLVSLDDYRKFALLYPSIEKVDVQPLNAKLLVTIATNNDQPVLPNSLLYRTLKRALEENGSGEFEIEIRTRRMVPIFIDAEVGLARGYQWQIVEAAIHSQVFDRFSFEQSQFGQSTFRSGVVSAIQDVDGVEYVKVQTFGGLFGSPEEPELSLAKLSDQRKVDKPVVKPRLGRFSNGNIIPAELAFFDPTKKENIRLSEARR